MRLGNPNPNCPACKGKGYTYLEDVCPCPPLGFTTPIERTAEQYIREENTRRGIK